MVTLDPILHKIETAKSSLEFIKTGFEALDDALDGGFLRKELIVLGAFTGAGKSYIAGQLTMSASKQGFKCAYFSLEISNEMIVSRMLGSLSNLKPTRIQTGLLDEHELTEKNKAKGFLQTLTDQLHFYDDLYELDKIVAEIKENKYEFVVIDFLQNIITKTIDEYSRLSQVALELQKVAKEVNCTILTLSQLSNSAAKDGSRGKTLEYKGSGTIATVCDLGFIFERIEESGSPLQEVKLTLKKNRRGNSGVETYLKFKVPGGLLYE